MKILIDILHPAHVHVFRNAIKDLQSHGHEIVVVARKKDVAIKLLENYDIQHQVLSSLGKSKIQLAGELIARTWKLYQLCRKSKPDLLIGCMGPSISIVGKLLNIPTIVFYNNESAKLVNSFVNKLATYYVTSSSYEEKCGKNHLTHQSYHELAYLHPNKFTPDESILRELRIKQPFFIVRLVSFASSHDFGVKGLAEPLKLSQKLEKYGRVIITSEKKLPAEFDKYRVSLSPERLHDLLAFAKMCVGESATLAAEAALLGVPAVYIASSFRGYTNELERDYGLVYNFKEQTPAEAKIVELLQKLDLETDFQERRKKMLADKISLTDWMVNFIENPPR